MEYNQAINTNPLNFNTAEPQQAFDTIPAGTVAKVRLTIKRGGYNNPAQGWTDDCATRNHKTGAVYLNCAFVILEGEYAKRKVWSLIGLQSPKGPEWGNIGRSFMRAILTSARGFAEEDTSPQALAARDIKSLAELDGLEFFARIDVEKNKEQGTEKNIIKVALSKGHKDYPGSVASEVQAALSRNAPTTTAHPWGH
jgi:hypothetical protein